MLIRHQDTARQPSAPDPTGDPSDLQAFFRLALASFFQNLSLQCFFHLPAYLEQRGSGEFAIGSIMAVLPAVAIAVRPALGAKIDGGGRQAVLRLGGVLHVLACLSYLLIPSLPASVLLSRVIHGVAQAALFSAMFTVAADLAPPGRRTQFLGWFGTSGMIGLTVSGAIGDAVLRTASYPGLFVVTAVFAILGTACLWTLPTGATAESRPIPAPGSRGAFLETVLQRDLRPVWALGFGYSLGVAACITFGKLWLVERGVGSLGSFFAAFGAAAIVLRVGFGSVPDRVGRKRILVPSVLLMAAGLLTLAQVSSASEVLLAGALCGLAHGYLFPIVTSLVIDRAGAARRGRGVALFTALFDAGVLLGGPSLGLLVEHSDHPTMFRVSAALVLLGAGVFFVTDRGRRA